MNIAAYEGMSKEIYLSKPTVTKPLHVFHETKYIKQVVAKTQAGSLLFNLMLGDLDWSHVYFTGIE